MKSQHMLVLIILGLHLVNENMLLSSEVLYQCINYGHKLELLGEVHFS
jgi:hypothetical protein